MYSILYTYTLVSRTILSSLPPSLSPSLPPSLTQLLTHEAVFRWDASIMEGILDMSKLLMELIAERLKQPHIPLILLHLLAIVCIHFNTDMYILYLRIVGIVYIVSHSRAM